MMSATAFAAARLNNEKSQSLRVLRKYRSDEDLTSPRLDTQVETTVNPESTEAGATEAVDQESVVDAVQPFNLSPSPATVSKPDTSTADNTVDPLVGAFKVSKATEETPINDGGDPVEVFVMSPSPGPAVGTEKHEQGEKGEDVVVSFNGVDLGLGDVILPPATSPAVASDPLVGAFKANASKNSEAVLKNNTVEEITEEAVAEEVEDEDYSYSDDDFEADNSVGNSFGDDEGVLGLLGSDNTDGGDNSTADRNEKSVSSPIESDAQKPLMMNEEPKVEASQIGLDVVDLDDGVTFENDNTGNVTEYTESTAEKTVNTVSRANAYAATNQSAPDAATTSRLSRFGGPLPSLDTATPTKKANSTGLSSLFAQPFQKQQSLGEAKTLAPAPSDTGGQQQRRQWRGNVGRQGLKGTNPNPKPNPHSNPSSPNPDPNPDCSL